MRRWKCNEPTDTQPLTLQIPTIEIEKSSDDKDYILPPAGNKLYFYSDITRDSIHVLNRQIDELTKQLKIIQICYNLQRPPVIELFISSDGGDFFPAISTADKIISNSIPIHTHCEGMAASAATLISVVGKRRTISRNTSLLIHQVSSGLWGNYQQIKDEMQNLSLIMKTMKRIYLSHTKFQESDLDELLKHDLCLNSEEALQYGLVDEIVG